MEGEFRLLDGAALSRVYRDHVRRDFPPAERKPLQAMERMRRIGRYDPLGYYSGEKLLGYAFLWRDRAGEYVLLDYLAVCPEGRGQGTGTAMLEGLNARYRRCRAILAEAEAVGEDALRDLRAGQGAAVLPPRRVSGFGVAGAPLRGVVYPAGLRPGGAGRRPGGAPRHLCRRRSPDEQTGFENPL